jgi:hypothetical protein
MVATISTENARQLTYSPPHEIRSLSSEPAQFSLTDQWKNGELSWEFASVHRRRDCLLECLFVPFPPPSLSLSVCLSVFTFLSCAPYFSVLLILYLFLRIFSLFSVSLCVFPLYLSTFSYHFQFFAFIFILFSLYLFPLHSSTFIPGWVAWVPVATDVIESMNVVQFARTLQGFWRVRPA